MMRVSLFRTVWRCTRTDGDALLCVQVIGLC